MCPFSRMVGEYYSSELQADFRRVQPEYLEVIDSQLFAVNTVEK